MTPLRPRLRSIAVTALAAALVLGGAAVMAPSAQAAPVGVSGVQLRWGFSNEANNRGFAPGTYNLFSAGRIGNPGAGNQMLTDVSGGAVWSNAAPANWNAHTGNVYVEKLRADGTYAQATWLGTKTDKNGTPLGSPASNTAFSDHQVVIDAGTGTVDAAANDADITWDGDVTVVFYSGLTFFYLSDPHLVIDNGAGSLTATLGGFSTAMNSSQWDTIPNTSVTLATLSGVDVTSDGLLTTPAYRGVTYDPPVGSGGAPQVRTGADWGAFPQSFVDFQQLTGQSTYWYSSGSSIDKNKPALPLTVDLTPGPHAGAPPRSTPTVSTQAGAATYGRANTVSVAVAGAGGTPTGSVTLTGAGPSQTKPLSGGRATFTLPKTLKPGKHRLTSAYAGDSGFSPAQGSGMAEVRKAGTRKPKLKLVDRPTPAAPGDAKVTVRSVVRGVKVTGKATVTLTKGSVTKKVTVTLKNGVARATLPALARGAWTASVVYKGSATCAAATSKTYAITIP